MSPLRRQLGAGRRRRSPLLGLQILRWHARRVSASRCRATWRSRWPTGPGCPATCTCRGHAAGPVLVSYYPYRTDDIIGSLFDGPGLA